MENSTDLFEDVNISNTNGNGSQFLTHSPNQILEIVAPHIVIIDRVVSPIWYVIGLFGNPVSAIIWLSRKIRKTNSSAVYFGSLAIVQTLYLLIHIIMELNLAWDVNTYHRPMLCEVFNFVMISPQYLVPMLVLGFTTERYIAVCHPFVKEKYCTVTRAKIVICCMAAFAVGLGSFQTYIWAWDDGLGCVFRVNTELFNTVWSWITEIVIFGLIPVSCLIINILVIREIKRLSIQSAARGQEGPSSNAASTTTLLAVSFYFIFTLLPATIVYVIQTSIKQGNPALPFSEWNSDPVWNSYFRYLTARKIVEEICLSNYAAYFVIYYTTGVYFRREFKLLIGLNKLKKHRYSSRRTTDSDYSLVNSNGKTMTETVMMDATSDQ